MDPTLPAGELLLSLTPPDPISTLGPVVWLGTGVPAQFDVPIPPDPGLAGLQLFTQGLIVDAVGSNTFGATTGLQVTIGN